MGRLAIPTVDSVGRGRRALPAPLRSRTYRRSGSGRALKRGHRAAKAGRRPCRTGPSRCARATGRHYRQSYAEPPAHRPAVPPPYNRADQGRGLNRRDDGLPGGQAASSHPADPGSAVPIGENGAQCVDLLLTAREVLDGCGCSVLSGGDTTDPVATTPRREHNAPSLPKLARDLRRSMHRRFREFSDRVARSLQFDGRYRKRVRDLTERVGECGCHTHRTDLVLTEVQSITFLTDRCQFIQECRKLHYGAVSSLWQTRSGGIRLHPIHRPRGQDRLPHGRRVHRHRGSDSRAHAVWPGSVLTQ